MTEPRIDEEMCGHVAMGYDISMPSLVGAASLAGIVVNNSILSFNGKFRDE